MQYLEKGVIDIPEVPGLGAVIDDRYLNKAEKVVL